MAWQEVNYNDGTRRRQTVPGVGFAVTMLLQPVATSVPVYFFGRIAAIAERARPVAPLGAKTAWWVFPEATAGVTVGLPDLPWSQPQSEE